MRGFTLIELLVVVTIIVVLLALLTPALDQAITQAEKAQCLSNVRNTGQACLQYAFDNRKTLPVYTMSGARNADGSMSDGCSSYDMRGPWGGLFALTGAKFPRGIGLLVSSGFLPSGPQLGNIAHCPTMDNMASPFPGHCMDRANPYGFGASFWNENSNHRIINGYNYRAPSYYNADKGHIRINRASGMFVVYVDTPDVRFRGRGGQYVHPDGYSRALGDGSASFLLDPDNIIEEMARAIAPSGDAHEGDMSGINHGPVSVLEEQVYDLMGRGSVVEDD
jgi:prepilin-type N-terminal cleavage/methylation domain-containing protein